MIPTFWANSYFDLNFDFVTILVPKNKKINSILVPVINPLIENSYMANRSPVSIENANMTIKIIFKNTTLASMSTSYFKKLIYQFKKN